MQTHFYCIVKFNLLLSLCDFQYSTNGPPSKNVANAREHLHIEFKGHPATILMLGNKMYQSKAKQTFILQKGEKTPSDPASTPE
jgi:hypothetical protein